MAPPGCPEFAFSTIAAERMRILSAAFCMIDLSFIKENYVNKLWNSTLKIQLNNLLLLDVRKDKLFRLQTSVKFDMFSG
jgi:hypothetical protein